MKACFPLWVFLLLIALVPTVLWAQQEGEPAPASGMFGGSGNGQDMTAIFGEAFGIQRLDCDELRFDSTGHLQARGDVKLRSEMVDLDCAVLVSDPEKKQIEARGAPVHIQQQDITARCRTFTYDIENRVSTLSGNPKIIQRQGEKTTSLAGGIIVITTDQEGNYSITIDRSERPEPDERVHFEVIDNHQDQQGTTGEQAPTSPSQPRKITGDNMDLLKIPTLE